MGKLDYTGRVAVVTGAGAGLGREYALLLGSRGAKIVVNDLGGDRSGGGSSRQADIVVNEIIAAGGIAVANYNSVTEGEKIIQTALDNYGRIDILINNAGILRDRSFARISDQDWDLIQDVHLKGAFKTTQAAWPIFKKQNYGRIILTSSNSGIIGNFGQANYSAAKTALIGLANTLAIEGAKNNIHCNVIVPTAASRLTEDVMPDFLLKELRPKLIAPVVAYLCHETNDDNGVIIDSAAGWAAKVHTVRGTGSILRKSLDEDVTIEGVRDAWTKVVDMSEATRLTSMADGTVQLATVLEDLKESSGSLLPIVKTTYRFGPKDIALYSLSIGASVRGNDELRFLYENDPNFAPFPTFFTLPTMILVMETGIVSTVFAGADINLANALHGEHYVEICSDLPTSGILNTKAKIIDVTNKKTGSVITVETETFDPNGNIVAKNQVTTFLVGGVASKQISAATGHVINVVSPPKRLPDATVQLKTGIDQAAIFRLTADMNPLHIDPNFSILGGHKIPILHGMCTLGYSMRAVLKTFANNDPSIFKAMKVRFVKPVIPGQTLKVDMWKVDKRIYFKTSIVETGVDVITGAYVDLKMVVQSNLTSSSESPSLKSDAIFERIADRVAAEPQLAKSVNGIFAYRITNDGKVVKEWTVDLKNANVYTGPPKDVKADTTLTVTDGDMLDIATGKLNGQVAFMKGKLKITGNIMLTQKLLPLLKVDAKL